MKDDLYPSCIRLAISRGGISESMIQREFLIGYNRASRLIEELVNDGAIGPRTPNSPMREYIGA